MQRPLLKVTKLVGLRPGGVMVAVANHHTAVVSTGGGEMESEEESEGIISELWVECQERLHIFVMYFWHSEGWSMRNEEVMSAVLRRVHV